MKHNRTALLPPTLEIVRRKAQDTANRDNTTVAILNLNSFTGLYVIREARPLIENTREFIEFVHPQA